MIMHVTWTLQGDKTFAKFPYRLSLTFALILVHIWLITFFNVLWSDAKALCFEKILNLQFEKCYATIQVWTRIAKDRESWRATSCSGRTQPRIE